MSDVKQAWERFKRSIIGDASPEDIQCWTGHTTPGNNFVSVTTQEAFEAGWSACFVAMCPGEVKKP